MKYKVRYLSDDNYEVYDIETDESMFSGNIAECEAWIRLTERGYL